MKIRNPKSKFHLDIKAGDRVLEVGSGDFPHPRANVLVDKYVNDNYHRCGDIRVGRKQVFVEADGTSLPFKDKEFDYVICSHTLEHVEDPAAFIAEQFRVARRGYMEIPSLLGEYLCPKESHKWISHEHNNVLYLVEKQKLAVAKGYDLGDLILEYLPKHSIGFKILERTHPNLKSICIEWENDFAFEINPQDATVMKYFNGPWQPSWGNEFFPPRSLGQEFKAAFLAFMDICRSVFLSKVLKKND